MDFQFNASSPFPFSVRERYLGLDGSVVTAKVRTTLRAGENSPEDVLVVSGPACVGRLPKEQREILSRFADVLRPFGAGVYESRTEIAMLKAAVNAQAYLAADIRIRSVAWDQGPIPVVQIGVAEGTPVYCTRTLQSEGKRRSPQRGASSDSKLVTLRALDTYCDPCFREYFLDIADQLRGVIFRKKSGASAACMKAERILQESVLAKLQIIDALPAPSDDVEIHEIYSRFQVERSAELEVVRASVLLIRAAIDSLLWCVSYTEDPKSAIEAALESITGLPDSAPERALLLQCTHLLYRCPEPEDANPLLEADSHDTRWLQDMLVACRFITELKQLVLLYGRHPLFMFISHHMETYGSATFYEQYRRYIALYPGSVVCWTGQGIQENVQISVLAKLWYSDVQVLYIPNTLALYRGGIKDLGLDTDWVIHELFFGMITGKKLRVIQAEGIDESKPNVRDKLLEQVARFNWDNLSAVFDGVRVAMTNSDYKRYGFVLYKRLKDHLANRTSITHHPQSGDLRAEDKSTITRACLGEALKQRLAETIQGLRNGLPVDAWRIVQGLLTASKAKSQQVGSTNVTAKEIEAAMQGVSRTDLLPITADWIRRVMWRVLSKQALYIENSPYKLVEEGPLEGLTKTYVFGLGQYTRDFHGVYPKMADKLEFDEIFKQIIQSRIGEVYASTSKTTIN